MVPRGGGGLRRRRRGRGVELGGLEEGEGLGKGRRRGGGTGGGGEWRIVGGRRRGGGGGSTEDLLVGRDLYEVLAGLRPLPPLLSVHGARRASGETKTRRSGPTAASLQRGTIKLWWARIKLARPI
jgi:hypothetical protein